MRFLLDTNILAFFILGDTDNISFETIEVLNDYNNQLFTSSINVLELLQLYNIGKIKSKKHKSANDLIQSIENEYIITILPFTKQHTETLSKLKIATNHNDPFDHSIIAHAITEKLILVSSDRKFKDYVSQKLLFSFNKR